MKNFRVVFFLVILVLVSIFMGCSKVNSLGNKKQEDLKVLKSRILEQKDKYLTVGAENCEFKTIKDALKAVDSKRNIIYIMDNFQTEASIIIEENVVIKGFGAGNSIIQAASDVQEAEDRVFTVEEEGKLVLENLTVQNGRVNKVPREGGGIRNRGILIIKDCIIRNNIATFGNGIYSEKYIEVENSIIMDNSFIKRPLAETQLGVGCWGSGGGVKVERGKGKFTNCSIIGNSVEKGGGGIKVSCNAKVSLINCTIAENKSEDNAGGVGISGEVTLIHCTITKNQSWRGAGIYLTGKGRLIGNIITDNIDQDLVVEDNSFKVGHFLQNEYNFIGDGKNESFLTGEIDLERIEDINKGYIVYVPKSNSSLVDAIPQNKSYVDFDQRGIERKDKNDDIGAYEYNGMKFFTIERVAVLIGIFVVVIGSYISKKHGK